MATVYQFTITLASCICITYLPYKVYKSVDSVGLGEKARNVRWPHLCLEEGQCVEKMGETEMAQADEQTNRHTLYTR